MAETKRRRVETSAAEPFTGTRPRILAAAMRCVRRWGIEKTGLGDIAKEAGCSRQTVYNHFADAESVILEALRDESHAFVARLIEATRREPRAGDRIVAAMMFCLDELPREPLLALVGHPDFAPLAKVAVFRSDATWSVLREVAKVCLEPEPALRRRTDELSEMMTRLLLSLLMLEGPKPRSEAQTRALVRRWLLPPLGLR